MQKVVAGDNHVLRPQPISGFLLAYKGFLAQEGQVFFDGSRFGPERMQIGFHLRDVLLFGSNLVPSSVSVMTTTLAVTTTIALAFLAATSLT